MRLADYVMQRVAEAGVGHVFMVPGGGAMNLNDALGMRNDLAFVSTLHEQAASIGDVEPVEAPTAVPTPSRLVVDDDAT